MPRLLALLMLAFAAPAFAADGLMSRNSPHDVEQTYRQLVEAIGKAGMKILLEIDHAENARTVSAELRPTRLVVFGNPKVGTALMQCGQTVAIDLPQRMLVWEDESGATKVAYNAPKYLLARHAVDGCKEERDKVAAALERLIAAAVR